MFWFTLVHTVDILKTNVLILIIKNKKLELNNVGISSDTAGPQVAVERRGFSDCIASGTSAEECCQTGKNIMFYFIYAFIFSL